MHSPSCIRVYDLGRGKHIAEDRNIALLPVMQLKAAADLIVSHSVICLDSEHSIHNRDGLQRLYFPPLAEARISEAVGQSC